MSRIGDWGERAYIHFYGRGLAKRLLEKLASHPGTFDTLPELMDVTFHKDSSGVISSTSNAFATSSYSVSLVGEVKTPSLPPSIHIPPIIGSQSLLPSIDEVFKEIKDVAISSIHLFQGDMDLPPLSFHASLEEKWDKEEEPEEIETVLKVVPPSYHQYFIVSFKVKAEKLPPHHACDHHIKL
ncbi:hypothetical protein O181_002973 [Austropuccinia psidii MF-1]|uniref:Uncharacterized protein n=1 Tax=Austropuccinia psidii MF-1 TaxID=1389203 RepID=A0A9Q3BDR7_9BASI|nr:hypothetical protein [Austropuccinia psidii MF-1]